MKKISVFIFCFTTIVLLGCGCKLLDELNKPKSKKIKRTRKTAASKARVLPDGSTVGLNEYEKEYLKAIDESFKRQRQRNAGKVFGGPMPRK